MTGSVSVILLLLVGALITFSSIFPGYTTIYSTAEGEGLNLKAGFVVFVLLSISLSLSIWYIRSASRKEKLFQPWLNAIVSVAMAGFLYIVEFTDEPYREQLVTVVVYPNSFEIDGIKSNSLEVLLEELEKNDEGSMEKRFALEAPLEVPYSRVTETIDELRAMGILSVSFIGTDESL